MRWDGKFSVGYKVNFDNKKAVFIPMTDRIRDEDLQSLIAWAETSNDLVLRALLELKERREEEKHSVCKLHNEVTP